MLARTIGCRSRVVQPLPGWLEAAGHWPAAAAARSATPAATAGFASAAAAAEPAPPDLRQAFSYCVSQVKKHDYENYLWVTQLAKVSHNQKAWLAVVGARCRVAMVVMGWQHGFNMEMQL